MVTFDQSSNGLRGGVNLARDSDGRLSTPAYALVRDGLRQEVISGQLPAGTRITIAEVAKRYGVSLMPVREAFQALEAEGVLERLPYKGARVRAMSRELVSQIFDLRGALELLMARLAMPNVAPAVLDRLSRLNAALRVAAERDDIHEVMSLNQDFHTLLYEHSYNGEALAAFNRSANLIIALIQQHGLGPERRRQIVDEHAQIIAALRTQDQAELARVVQAHYEGAKAELLSCMPPD